MREEFTTQCSSSVTQCALMASKATLDAKCYRCIVAVPEL